MRTYVDFVRFVLFGLTVCAACNVNDVTTQQINVVHGCKDHVIRLNCRVGVIEITHILLGDSSCSGSSCCPRATDCHINILPSDGHKQFVDRSCNGQRNCAISTEIRKIGCSYWGPNSDYENITYICKEVTTTVRPTRPTTIPSTPLRSTPTPSSSSSSSSATQELTRESRSNLSTASTSAKTKEDKDYVGLLASSQLMPSLSSSPDYVATSSSPIPPFQLEKDTKSLYDGDPEVAGQQQRQDLQDESNPVSTNGVFVAITTVVVGGVIIMTIIISVAVVVALKKRRRRDTNAIGNDVVTVQTFPNRICFDQAERSNDVRNSNIYEDIRDSGNSSEMGFNEIQFCEKEDEYLKPMTENEEMPYMWLD